MRKRKTEFISSWKSKAHTVCGKSVAKRNGVNAKEEEINFTMLISNDGRRRVECEVELT